uniref:Lysophospholipid acyltransferase 5 n=1 Tax=Angiostrongylus cantonensis TaxID=6313 RepID=A0A0K0DMJ8_ANGCA
MYSSPHALQEIRLTVPELMQLPSPGQGKGYLLVAYWFEESDGYDITWTTPFCVMTLRFIGLVMDVYDGIHYKKLKEDQKKTAIQVVPGLLEIAAFGFFYTGTFAGPQFTLIKFRQCISGEWLDEQKRPRQSA